MGTGGGRGSPCKEMIGQRDKERILVQDVVFSDLHDAWLGRMHHRSTRTCKMIPRVKKKWFFSGSGSHKLGSRSCREGEARGK